MRSDTRLKFNAYLKRQAELNGVPSAGEKFTVAPTVEQILEERIQEQADFLKLVNVVPVRDMVGEKLGLGASGPAAGRTNTITKDRATRDLLAMDKQGYACVQTNFDTHVRYQTLDMWSKFPDFQVKLRNKVIEQIARDRLMIGWNGQSAAAETDLSTNPLLQDVNVGWLQHIRTKAPERRMGSVKIGDAAGRDYKNLDIAVQDIVSNLMDTWHAKATDLVVILGDGLLNDKYIGLMNSADAPTEHIALQTLMLTKTVGGRKAMAVPFMPARSLLVTSTDNLSIYYQLETRRRAILDNPKRDRIEDYNSVNEGYVIEDFGKCALLDAIELPSEADGGGWE